MLRLSNTGTQKDIIPEGLRPATFEDLMEAFSEYRVALDTNILTFIYKCDEYLAKDLVKILEHLAERIFIPYQVAREFDRHRPDIERDAKKPQRQLAQDLKDFGNKSKAHVSKYWKQSNPSNKEDIEEFQEFKDF